MTSPMTTHQLIDAKGILPRRFSPAGRAKAAAAAAARSARYRQQIEKLAREGAGTAEIADRLQRTCAAIRTAASTFNIKLPRRPRPYTAQNGGCLPKGKPMEATAPAASPSAGAMRAQAQMFRLLDEHFDVAKGRNADGWNDDRVAKECALSPAMVREFRRAGFGELKANPEIEKLAADISALRAMLTEELAQLEARLRRIEAAK